MTMIRELRYALRSFSKARALSAIVVLTLAVGIGATTAIFSLLNAVVLRPLPYPGSDQLVLIWAPHKLFAGLPLNILGPANADALALKRDIHALANVSQFRPQAFSLETRGTPIRVSGARVDAGFFETLQVAPVLGRGIGLEEDRVGGERAIVISAALWQRAFENDSRILERTVRLDGQAYHVIGVMHAGFRFPRSEDLLPGEVEGRTTDFWIPLATPAQERESLDFSDNTTIARLLPGVTVEQAQREVAQLMAQRDLLRPAEMRGWSGYVQSLVDASTGGVRRGMWLLFAAVALVLTLACSNAAHLLLARAADRVHEMGVRSALGASRRQLIRQTLIESAMLAIGGGILGIAFASVAVRVLVRLNPSIPRLDEASIDGRVLTFTLVASIVTGLLFGLLPALWASSADVLKLLRHSHDRASSSDARLGPALIVGEVVLAVVLLVGAGLFIRSYQRVRGVDPGFATSAVTTRIVLDTRYAQPAERRKFFEALLAEVRRTIDAPAIGLVDALPLSRSERLNPFEIEGRTPPLARQQLVQGRSASPEYFQAIGMPLVEGRTFTESDREGRPQVLVVNQAFAKLHFPGESAIGRRLTFLRDASKPLATIVGVVGDVRHSSVEDPPQPQVYESFWQSDITRAYLVVKPSSTPASSSSTAAIGAASRATLQRIDPSLAIADARPMQDLVREARAHREFQTFLVVVLSAVALVLAATGLYGVMAHMVRRRTRELGIRLALGAQRQDVLMLVLRRGLGLTLLGLTVGLACAMASTRLIAARLYGVTPTDGITVGGVSLLLIGVAAMSCLLPSLRASRLDPVRVFRAD
jgi:predicted permease